MLGSFSGTVDLSATKYIDEIMLFIYFLLYCLEIGEISNTASTFFIALFSVKFDYFSKMHGYISCKIFSEDLVILFPEKSNDKTTTTTM